MMNRLPLVSSLGHMRASLTAALVGILAPSCVGDLSGDPVDARTGASDGPAIVQDARTTPDGASPSSVTVMLDFEGPALSPGSADDPASNTTVLISSSADFPPFSASVLNTSKSRSEVISDIVIEVQSLFAAFAVDVTTVRPANGEFVLVVVGGSPSVAGMPSGMANASAIDCNNTTGIDAVGMVFTDALNLFSGLDYEAARARLAVLIAQTVGSSAGLDAVTDCPDVMASPFVCSSQTFANAAINCGTSSARSCQCGGSTQNSYQALLTAFGSH